MDYFSEDPLINISSEPASSSPIATPKSANRFGRNTDLDSLSPLFFSPHGKGIGERSNMTVGDVIVELCTLFRRMSLRLKRQLVTYLFRQLLRNTVSDVGFLKFVGKNFLDISVQAMQKLYCAGKNNLVYLLSQCFQAPEDRPNSATATRLPLDRSRLDQQDVAEISVGLEDSKTVQEAAGVNPQASWQKQNSGIYNSLKVHFCTCEILLMS